MAYTEYLQICFGTMRTAGSASRIFAYHRSNPDDRHSGFFATKELAQSIPRQREETGIRRKRREMKVKMDVVPSLGFRTWFLVSFRSMVPR